MSYHLSIRRLLTLLSLRAHRLALSLALSCCPASAGEVVHKAAMDDTFAAAQSLHNKQPDAIGETQPGEMTQAHMYTSNSPSYSCT